MVELIVTVFVTVFVTMFLLQCFIGTSKYRIKKNQEKLVGRLWCEISREIPNIQGASKPFNCNQNITRRKEGKESSQNKKPEKNL